MLIGLGGLSDRIGRKPPLVLALFCILALASVPDTAQRRPVAWVRLPYFPSGTFLFGCAITTAWAAMGIIIVLVSAQLARSGLVVWSGAYIFLLVCVGLFVLGHARRMAPRRGASGLFLTPLGYVLSAAGAATSSVGIVMAGAALSSASCFGFTYVGGLAAVSEKAGDQHRARATSGFFLFAYFGFSLPVVLTGFLADAVGLLTALRLFGGMLVLANGVIGVLLRRERAMA